MASFFPQRVRQRTQAWLLLASGVLALLLPLAAAAVWPQAFERLECWTVDLRFALRPPLAVSDDIVLIDYDDAAAQAYGLGRWPWDRRVHAEVLDWLAEGGARGAVIDLVFDHPAGSVQDEALSAGMARTGMTVLPALLRPVPEGESQATFPAEFLQFFWRGQVSGNGTLPGMKETAWPLPLLATRAAAVGHIQRTPDPDGVLRRVPLLYASPQGFLPAVSLAAALRQVNGDLATLQVERGRGITFQTKSGRTIRLPIDRQGRTWINYAGPWGQQFTHFPYSWLRDEIEQADGRSRLHEWFQDKTVILTNLTTGSGDFGATPFDRDFPLGEIHAHLMNMILTQEVLRDAGPVERSFSIVAPTALVMAAALAGGPSLILPTFGVALLGFLMMAQHAFAGPHVILPVVVPVLSLSLNLVLLLAVRFFMVDRERLRFLSILGGLLPPHAIQTIEENPQQIPHLLAGRRRELTMVFADMQAFSEFSQKADALEVQRVLREYRTVVTDALRSHGGTLEKYTGDEVMAFFGDAEPIGGNDDDEESRVTRQAANAVRAGLAVQQGMAALNAKWREEGRPQHLVRVGINTGPVTVGNFGTEHLWQYGVVGSEVNKAKRLEGAAEPGGLLLSRRTYALARQQGVLPNELSACSIMMKGLGEEGDLYAITPKMVAEMASGGIETKR